MFTGIVQTTGKIEEIEKRNQGMIFTIGVEDYLDDVKIGDSISVDGVCLTVIFLNKDSFKVELMPETLRITRFSDLEVGVKVNLEKSLVMNGKLDGHIVLGHADGVGIVKNVIKEGEFVELIIEPPKDLEKYIAYKGSISVNGVSLTISGLEKKGFKVSLITHTLEITNLSDLKEGDKVNLEVDIIARYLERMLKDIKL